MNRRSARRLALAVALAVAISAVAFLTRARPDAERRTLPVRPPAADFALRSFDGRQATLRQFRGRPVVMNFWASWCVPCRAEAPNLERAWQTYRPRGVVFLGVDVADTEADARAFIATFKVSYLNVRDPSQHVMSAYRVTGIPTTVFIDRAGRIQRRYAGAFLGEPGLVQLSAWVEEVLR